VVQRRSEAAGVASRWTVVKVARGADDAHCRGRLVGFIWRELHHDSEIDVAVLLRVLQAHERGHQWSSVVISGHQWSSVVISAHQWSSGVIRGHQWSSVVIHVLQPSEHSISSYQKY
jgi:hypothetical protein